MKCYSSYRDSGLAFVEKIPQHWDVKRAKYFFYEIDERSEKGDEELLSVSHITGVTLRSEKNITMFMAESYEGYKTCITNDLVINIMWAWMGALGVSKYQGIISSAYGVYRQKNTNNFYTDYLEYLVRIPEYIAEYTRRSKGIRSSRLRMYSDDFFQIPIICPPIEEQKQIAQFLDRKLEQIDQFISNKQRLIELLKEQKTAIINRAVTKGLNPHAPMKPSSIEWLGEIPEHWKVIRISRIAKVVNGTTPDKNRPKYWESGSIPWISSGQINDYIITRPTELITEAAFKECSLRIMPAGAVVIGLVGQGKTRGTSARLAIDTCINQNLACIIPKLNLDSTFLHFTLIALYEPIRESARGGNQEALNCQLVREIRIPFPPISEQKAIAAYIDKKVAEINISIKRIQKSINLVSEYRTTLISDAVTGKIDVRETSAVETTLTSAAI